MSSPVQETNIPAILGSSLPREYQAVIREHRRLTDELARVDEYASYLRRVARAANVELAVPTLAVETGRGAASAASTDVVDLTYLRPRGTEVA